MFAQLPGFFVKPGDGCSRRRTRRSPPRRGRRFGLSILVGIFGIAGGKPIRRRGAHITCSARTPLGCFTEMQANLAMTADPRLCVAGYIAITLPAALL